MANEILRRALIRGELDPSTVAARLGVDPKTVLRWIEGRIPHAGNRRRLAALLDLEEPALWPQMAPEPFIAQPAAVDLRAFYPHRWAVPRDVWRRFFAGAHDQIAILAYAGIFLAEDLDALRVIADRARSGIAVRILLGDPDSPYVAARGRDEGVGESMAARIRNALILYRPLLDIEGIELRLHGTTLYTSIYRADDELLVNLHAYGITASNAPILHVRKIADEDLANTYLDSFERVWIGASPIG